MRQLLGEAREITRETLTVADKINFIMERIEKEEGIRFEDLFEDGFTRVTLIVMFLALLELIRLGLVKIYQEKAFGVIWVITCKFRPDIWLELFRSFCHSKKSVPSFLFLLLIPL